MTTQCITKDTPRDRDLLLWDVVDMSWQIGHWDAEEGDWASGSRLDDAEVYEYEDGTSEETVMIFTQVSHWHELPDTPEDMR